MHLFRHIRLITYTLILIILALVLVHASTRVQAANEHAPPASGALAPTHNDEQLEIALHYIQQSGLRDDFTTADLAHYRITDQYQTQDTQTTHINLLQQHAGLDVVGANLNLSLAPDGTVINFTNHFIPNLLNEINSEPAQLTAVAAMTKVAQHLNLNPTAPFTIQKQAKGADQTARLSHGGLAAQEIMAHLVYQPTANDGVRLAWHLQISHVAPQPGWDIRVDALTGAILAADELALHEEGEQVAGNSPLAAAPLPAPDDRSLTDANLVCNIYPSPDVPQFISTVGMPSVSSVLTVTVDGTITDINVVSLSGTHTWISDLDFNLISPAATAVEIMERSCDAEDNFNLNLDDSGVGPAPAWPCPPTDGGTYQPSNPLAAFNGESPNGIWTLRVDDNENDDGGSLDSWGLEVCYTPLSDFAVEVTPATLEVCSGNDGLFNVDIAAIGTYSDPVSLSAISTPGGASLSFGTNPVNPPGSSSLTVSNPATSYTIAVSGVGSSGTHTDTIALNLINSPTAVTLLTPADGAIDQSATPAFTWSAVPAATGYSIEIATDLAFSNVVDSAAVAGTSYNGASLNGGTTYYWHVIANNSCGNNTSATFSFTTIAPAGSPTIEVGPSSLESTQLPAEQVGHMLTISNTGTAALTWTLIEDDTLLQPAPLVSPWTADPRPSERLTAVMSNFLADQQPVTPLLSLPATPCVSGMAGSYPCNNVDLMAFMPLASIGGDGGNDIWGWSGCSGREFAIMGRTNGTAFVEITDPENPIYLGNLPQQTGMSPWRDIKTFNNYAFIVSEASNHGMQIFNLNQLCSIGSPPVTFSNSAHYSGFGNAHNLVINPGSGYAYAVGTSTCSGGLHMVDINSPTNPTFAGCFSSDGYTHDAQCVIYNGPDLDHIGGEICFNANEDTLTIVDVTDKSNPTQLSSTSYAGNAYAHQGWLTEDMAYYLLDDEKDEQTFGHNTRTRVWDISDLENPAVNGVFDNSTSAIDHNLYLKGHSAYEANYQAGLRILDATDASNGNLSEIGYFDIYPAGDTSNFNGAWSVYPYFDSDIVVVSGIEQGLFILNPTLTAVAADFVLEPTQVVLDICGVDNDNTTFSLDDVYGFGNAVTMSVSGLPTGTSANFATNPVTPPDTTLLTVDNASAATGNYLLTVEGTGGGVTHTEYLRLNVEAAAGAATLVSPLNGATDQPLVVTLTWTAAANANEYLVEVATDMAFTNIVYSALVAGTSDTTTTLMNDTQYFWRVSAQNDCSAAVSAVWSFTTVELFCTTPLDIPWLSASVSNGTIPAGNSTTVDMTFDSAGYGAGVYTATVCLNSNDNLLPQIQIPLTMTVRSTDYSDLPPSYGTAAHIGTGGLRLGADWTADTNFGANNDDATDDGVTRTGGAWLGGNTVTVTVNVRDGGGAAATGYVAGWIDWDDDGAFAPGEQIFGQSATGSQAISLVVPGGYVPGDTPTIQARFRLYTAEPTLLGTETPTGNTDNGEVEDYSWSFSPTAVSLRSLSAHSSLPWVGWLAALILLPLVALYLRRPHS